MSSTHDVMFCAHCGDRLAPFANTLGFCARCARNYRGLLARGAGSAPVRAHPFADETPKDPLLSTLLSIAVPGGGQVYNRHFFKGLIVFVTSPLVLPYFLGIVDAYFSARRINARWAAYAPAAA